MPMSPAAAAKKAGVSRSLISREIKSGAIPATLKNNGHHSISESDLQDWMDRRTERAPAPEPARPDTVTRPADHDRIEALTHKLATTKEALARLEGQAEATAARVADLAADRDAWRAQAERLSEARTVAASGIWSRIFGR
jgi:chromosome segregation ATPase